MRAKGPMIITVI